ncbi:MAG: FKBP-type peptidyl-prolyl cis-trans isomerase [Alphaproteobacteria bacterium]|nr:FKBP-type peptidyl-prolyl cis-trans isomerase [Alphaproteobacteria bacterium]
MMRFAPPLAFALLALLALPAAAEKYGLSHNENLRFLDDMAHKPGILKLPQGVMVRVLASGKGEAVTGRADKVTVSYNGYLINGVRFGGTLPGKPQVFTVSRVVPGWTEALLQMHEGDSWEVIVPADQAYGEGSAGNIPPDQSLLFVIRLEHVEHPS